MSYEFFKERIQKEIDHDKEQSQLYGWEFKPRDPDVHTIGDIVGATMKITDPGDARLFFEGQVAWLMKRFSKTKEEAMYVARSNIGWCFGEGMKKELVAMWNQTVKASHPAFGNHLPETPAEAIAAGRVMAGGSRRAQRHPKG